MEDFYEQLQYPHKQLPLTLLDASCTMLTKLLFLHGKYRSRDDLERKGGHFSKGFHSHILLTIRTVSTILDGITQDRSTACRATFNGVKTTKMGNG